MPLLDLEYIGSFQHGPVYSSEDPLEEVWAHVSRWGIEEWVRAMAAKQTTPIATPWSAFGPYAVVRIRQAVEFRDTARRASLLTAPLPLYYAFLNLERGLFALGEHRAPSPHHGLRFHNSADILDCQAEIVAGTFNDYLTVSKVSASIGKRITLREALARIPEFANDLYNSSVLRSAVMICRVKAVLSGTVLLQFVVPPAEEAQFRADWITLFPPLAAYCDLEPTGATLKVRGTVDTSDSQKIAEFLDENLSVPLVQAHSATWYAIPVDARVPALPRAAWYLISMFILGSVVRYEPELIAAIAARDTELRWLLTRYLRVAERFLPQLMLMDLYGTNVYF